jgi:D-glycero-alpha-D-manno-heptose 1-phosphate guanylyltransferase
LANEVRGILSDSYGSVSLRYSAESSPLGTGGALRLALPLFKSENILVLNGDSFCEISLNDFWTSHHGRAADASLVLTQVTDAGRYGRVQLNRVGWVVGFDEKSSAGPGWINSGIYLINKRLLQAIESDRATSLEREIFPHWIQSRFYGYRSGGRFIDIGTPESYFEAQTFVARTRENLRDS